MAKPRRGWVAIPVQWQFDRANLKEGLTPSLRPEIVAVAECCVVNAFVTSPCVCKIFNSTNPLWSEPLVVVAMGGIRQNGSSKSKLTPLRTFSRGAQQRN